MMRASGFLRSQIGHISRRTFTVNNVRRLPASASRSVMAESFMNGSSSVYVEQMYESWRSDPNSVHKSWDAYFRNVEAGAAPGQAFQAPPSLVPSPQAGLVSYPATSTNVAATGDIAKAIQDHLKIQLLIRSYQTRGHNIADLDPLGINSADLDDTIPRELELDFYGFTEKDLDREFFLPPTTFIGGDRNSLPLREIINRLKSIYCLHTGVEYMHLTNYEQQEWIRKNFEQPRVTELTPDQKKVLFKRLIRSTKFEEFLAKKWPSEKRFGLEGCEVLIPAIKQVVDRSSTLGVDSVVIGMPHRGRLNVLANVCRQPLETILSQFSTLEPADEGSGDVKYHLGVCIERFNRQSQRKLKIAVVANPSHLEAVDPVVQGKLRAEAFYSGDSKCDRHLAIMLHGDAAFSGQGVVMETFNLDDLPSYTVHGAIHIVVNNQIGFTTDPRSSRSSPYCTDVGRVVGCPIFHVNVDDPEAVMHVCNVAADWRKTFKKDVIIDLVCYRRQGHNELDEPMFTQPLMYQRIKKTKPLLDQYQNKIIGEGVVDEQYIKDELNKYGQILEDAYEAAQKVTHVRNRDWLDSPWDDFFRNRDPYNLVPTGIEQSEVQNIIDKFASVPEGFNLHRGLERTLKGRRQMLEENSLDWACGEALAFGSLLKEGIHVRLSGQDVERGTFSHRHHVLHDQKIDQKIYNPLNDLSENQAEYTVCNSSLSEYAVLGFELGYSMVNPNSLVIWEAQFGDFSNTAQCIIDQFISSGQSKWIRQSGLVMLLPHGYEGMGPEHSSARPERFLQMCNEDDNIDLEKVTFDKAFPAQQLQDTNWIIANCTTPANLFHILRRQVLLPFRKPLVIMSPKSLLRHPSARSPVEQFLPETHFKRVIFEEGSAQANGSNVERLVFCTGKVYYDLVVARKQLGLEDKVAITRVEQISPFPYDRIQAESKRYPNAQLIWAQEEHKNMGAWAFIQPRFNSLHAPENRCIKYAGRKPSASPATGNKYTHINEQKELLAQCRNMERIYHYKDLIRDVLEATRQPAVFQKSILTSGVLTDEDGDYAERIYSPSVNNFRKNTTDTRLELILIVGMGIWSLFSNFLWNSHIELNVMVLASLMTVWCSPCFSDRPLTTKMEVLFGLATLPPILVLGNLLSFFDIKLLFNIPIFGFLMAAFIYKLFIIIGFFYHNRLLKYVAEEEIQASRLIRVLTNMDYFSTIKKEEEICLKHLEIRQNIVENLKGKLACFRLMKDMISQITIYKTGAPDVYTSAHEDLKMLYCNPLPQDFLAKKIGQFWGFVSMIQSETFLELFLCLQQPLSVYDYVTRVFTFHFLHKTSVVKLIFSSESFKKKILSATRKQQNVESTECDKIFTYLIPLNEVVTDSSHLPEDRTLLIDAVENILRILTNGESCRKRRLKEDMNEEGTEEDLKEESDDEDKVLNQQYEKVTEDVKAFIENKGIIEGWLKSNLGNIQLTNDEEGEDRNQADEDNPSDIDDSAVGVISNDGCISPLSFSFPREEEPSLREMKGEPGIKHELLNELFKSPKSLFQESNESTFYE